MLIPEDADVGDGIRVGDHVRLLGMPDWMTMICLKMNR